MNKWDGNYIICSIARSAQNIIPLYVLNYFSDVNLMFSIPYRDTGRTVNDVVFLRMLHLLPG